MVLLSLFSKVKKLFKPREMWILWALFCKFVVGLQVPDPNDASDFPHVEEYPPEDKLDSLVIKGFSDEKQLIDMLHKMRSSI